MPTWVKVAMDAWTTRAGVTDGYLFLPVHRGDELQGERLPDSIQRGMRRRIISGISRGNLQACA